MKPYEKSITKLSHSALDKGPLESKKFIVTVLSIIAISLLSGDAASITYKLAALFVMGFIVIAYIGGQTYLDQYVGLTRSLIELPGVGVPPVKELSRDEKDTATGPLLG